MSRSSSAVSSLRQAQQFGQSVWYDNIRRSLITSGELQRMVEQDGVSGVTSNPSIFEKALAGSTDYDPAAKALVAQGVGDAKALFEALAVEDIQLAADILLPVYESTAGRDGFVSMEVSPYLARDTEATVTEARRLHRAIGRANVMIKVPATPEGIPAIRRLIAEGLHVNVTLLFSVDVYARVADAFIEGLEQRAAAGDDVSAVASVASFFVSRIDSVVDQQLCAALDETRDEDRRSRLKRLVGRVAIANARVAYARFGAISRSARWQELAAKGARPQRLLWASTGTKNPKYRDTLYVEELIGPDTVDTMPAETLRAFRATGEPRASLVENWDATRREAAGTLEVLEGVGISLTRVTDELLADGVRKFAEAFDTLLAAVERKRQGWLGGCLSRQSADLDEATAGVVASTLEAWRVEGKVRRMWEGDSTIWSGADEDRWLGWLDVVEQQRGAVEPLQHIVRDVRQAGFRSVLLLGMGGSSLCPEVMSRTFGPVEGAPRLHVLDSTIPAQVRARERAIDLSSTLFIVSSKSGGTTEPNVFKQYFFDRVARVVGAEQVGARFVAITDPGSGLHKIAKRDRFRHIAHGVPSIGGRYSALSNFGLVPSAVMGVDVPALLDTTEVMVQSCASSVPPEVNPGVRLGVILGTSAQRGRDKVTFVTSPGIAAIGAWLEQLIAESTGKHGRGLVPVDGEVVGPPDVYGDDRLFVYLRLDAAPDPAQDAAVGAIAAAGHPVVRITIGDRRDLGQEFFRWEIATAVAGAVLGINAFDQPDVEASKVATRKLTEAFEATGVLPEEVPTWQDGDMRLFADLRNRDAIGAAAGAATCTDVLGGHLARLGAGDYFAINAYVEMHAAHDRALQAIRHLVRDRRRVATTIGYGPRFLHSTGQLHKGGPNSGVFVQLTADAADDLPIPGQRYTFGTLARFQAQGDLDVLNARKRRVLRVHLGPDVQAGLARLGEAVASVLS